MVRTQQYLGKNTAISWWEHSNIMVRTQQYLGENTAISWREEVTYGWDDDICFVLATPTHLPGVLYCYICSSLKQSAGRHVAPFGHIILIPSQPACALSPKCRVLSGKEANTNLTVLDLTRPLPTTLMTSTPLHQRCGRFICYIDYRDNTFLILNKNVLNLNKKVLNLNKKVLNFNKNVLNLNKRFLISTKTFSIWTKMFSIWTKTFSIWTKTFSISTKTVLISTKTFSIWTKTFSIWTKTFSISTKTFSISTKMFSI
jgi:hypothetical protein